MGGEGVEEPQEGKKAERGGPRKEAPTLIPAIIEIRDRHVPRDDGVLLPLLPPFDNLPLPSSSLTTNNRDVPFGASHAKK